MTYRLTRRSALRTAGLGAAGWAGLALVGCGGSKKNNQNGPSSSASKPSGTTAAAQASPAAGTPKRGQVANIGTTQPPRSFDLMQETFNDVINSAGPCYDTILQFDYSDSFDTKVAPGLAEKSEQPDDSTYLLHFRPGVKWHDGQPFTAADAVFSLERMRNPPSGVVGPRKTWWTQIDKLEAIDSQTLKITLKRPQAALPNFLAGGWSVMMPQHLLAQNQDALKRTMVGTGPYKVDKVDFNVSGSLVRNPEYWNQGKPYLDGVKFTILTVDSLFTAFRSGRIDWQDVNAEQWKVVKSEMPKIVTKSLPSFLIFHLRMNGKKPPFSDVRVRQAVSYAIDRDSVLQGIDFGMGNVGGPLPATGNWNLPDAELQQLPGYHKDKKDKDADIAKAKQLLAAAGYPNGFSAGMMLGEGPTFDNGGLIILEQLKAIGIQLTAKKEEFVTFLDRTDKSDFDTAPYELGGTIDDADDFLQVQFKTGAGRNYVGYSDPQVDQMLDQQSMTLDNAKRKEIVLNIQRRLLDQVPLAFVHWPQQLGVWQPWVQNRIYHSSLYNHYRADDIWEDSH